MPPKKTHRVEDSSRILRQSVIASHNVFEHPASAEEFEAVAVLAAFECEADESRFALPPLWPMLLHMVFADITLPPLGDTMEPEVRDAFGVVLSKTDAAKLDRVFIPAFVRALRSSIHRHQHSGVVGIRKVLLREKPSSINEVIAAGAVPLLAALLHDDDRPRMQHEAAWALRMVAGGTTRDTEFRPAWKLTSYWTDTTDQTARIVNTPEVIASLVRVLGSADHNICEHAIRVLGNIALVSASHCDVLLKRGVLTELMGMMSRSDLSADPLTVRRHVTWATACLCCDTPLPPLSSIVAALPLFVEAIHSPDTDLAVTAMRCLEFFCSGTRDHMSAVVDHGALPAILRHAASGVWDLMTPAVCCLGYIFRGDNHHIAAAIELGTISTLCTVLQARSGPSWREGDVLWALSNIAGGNAQRINALLQAGVFSLIADAVGSRAERSRLRSQRIVTKALRNASPADRTAIISSPSFQALLTAASTRRILLVGLEGIDYAVTHGLAAVEAVTSLAELSISASALQKIKEPRMQYHAGRINALIHGEAPEDSVGEAGARRGRKKSATNSPQDEVSTG
jgi:hypothetical protein